MHISFMHFPHHIQKNLHNAYLFHALSKYHTSSIIPCSNKPYFAYHTICHIVYYYHMSKLHFQFCVFTIFSLFLVSHMRCIKSLIHQQSTIMSFRFTVFYSNSIVHFIRGNITLRDHLYVPHTISH